jgi:Ribosomal RNA adenine dimethylase
MLLGRPSAEVSRSARTPLPCRACSSHLSVADPYTSVRQARDNGSMRCHALSDSEASSEAGLLWEPSLAKTRRALRSINARPKKALGQNFISEASILQRIVKQGGIKADDILIEIGPGTGNLTQELLTVCLCWHLPTYCSHNMLQLLLSGTNMYVQTGATVLVVEKDYALAERLEKMEDNGSKFKVVQGDVLRLNLADLIDEARDLHGCNNPKRVRIVANLPYYITTDLLKRLLPEGESVESLLLLLQDEVAQRLTTAHPGALQFITELLFFLVGSGVLPLMCDAGTCACQCTGTDLF